MARKKEKKVQQYMIKLDPEQHKIWRLWSIKLDRHLSDIVKEAMSEYLARISSRPLGKHASDYEELLQ